MDEAPIPDELPGNLKFLRILVTILTATMIVGLLTVVTLLVMRLSDAPAPLLGLPEAMTLPEGAKAQAFTQGGDWYAVVTDQDQILIFDRASGALKQTVDVE